MLFISLLPGAGNFAGGLIAEYLPTSQRQLNWALHAASGIVIGIVALELLPGAVEALPTWWIAGGFAAGGCAYILLERVVGRLQNENGRRSDRARMWMIYSAVAMDLSSDGLMIGAGSAVSTGLALTLATGQVLADVPEGYASVANFRDKGVPRSRRLMLSSSFFVFVVSAALLSYLLLRGFADAVKLGALVVVAGLLTVAAVEDMLEEAHASREDTSGSVLAFVAGFALFALVSGGLETLI